MSTVLKFHPRWTAEPSPQLASYIAAVLPVVGELDEFPLAGDPGGEALRASAEKAIHHLGWPEQLADMVAFRDECVAEADRAPIGPHFAALIALVEISTDRIEAAPVKSARDASALFAYLRGEFEGTDPGPWSEGMFDRLQAWLRREAVA